MWVCRVVRKDTVCTFPAMFNSLTALKRSSYLQRAGCCKRCVLSLLMLESWESHTVTCFNPTIIDVIWCYMQICGETVAPGRERAERVGQVVSSSRFESCSLRSELHDMGFNKKKLNLHWKKILKCITGKHLQLPANVEIWLFFHHFSSRCFAIIQALM